MKNTPLIKNPIIPKTTKNESTALFPNNTPQTEIDKILQNQNYKYFIVEKNNETHIVKIKNNGLNMKPFVESVINHLLTKKKIIENISKMKVIGNDNFCILKNSPQKTKFLIKEILKNTLK